MEVKVKAYNIEGFGNLIKQQLNSQDKNGN